MGWCDLNVCVSSIGVTPFIHHSLWLMILWWKWGSWFRFQRFTFDALLPFYVLFVSFTCIYHFISLLSTCFLGYWVWVESYLLLHNLSGCVPLVYCSLGLNFSGVWLGFPLLLRWGRGLPTVIMYTYPVTALSFFLIEPPSVRYLWIYIYIHIHLGYYMYMVLLMLMFWWDGSLVSGWFCIELLPFQVVFSLFPIGVLWLVYSPTSFSMMGIMLS